MRDPAFDGARAGFGKQVEARFYTRHVVFSERRRLLIARSRISPFHAVYNLALQRSQSMFETELGKLGNKTTCESMLIQLINSGPRVNGFFPKTYGESTGARDIERRISG